MAQKIPNEMIPHITKAAPRTEYGWEQYDDGGWWKLQHGEDYHVQTSSARMSAVKWAEKNGRKAEMSALKESDGFVLRFVTD